MVIHGRGGATRSVRFRQRSRLWALFVTARSLPTCPGLDSGVKIVSIRFWCGAGKWYCSYPSAISVCINYLSSYSPYKFNLVQQITDGNHDISMYKLCLVKKTQSCQDNCISLKSLPAEDVWRSHLSSWEKNNLLVKVCWKRNDYIRIVWAKLCWRMNRGFNNCLRTCSFIRRELQ